MTQLKNLAQSFILSSLLHPYSAGCIDLLENYIDTGAFDFTLIKGEFEEIAQRDGKPADFDKEVQFWQEVAPEIIKLLDFKVKQNGHHSNRKSFLLHLLGDILREYQLIYEIKQSSNIEIPEHLVMLRHKKDTHLLRVSDSEILDKGYRVKNKNNDLVVYPAGNPLLCDVIIGILRKDQGKLNGYILPKYIGEYANYSNEKLHQLDKMHGMQFTKENLRKCIQKEYGVYSYTFLPDSREAKRAERSGVPLRQLEYVIKPKQGENIITLSIEETIDIDKDYMRMPDFKIYTETEYYVRHRMLHAEMKADTLDISHIDLSHLYYDLDSYLLRTDKGTHIQSKTINATVKKKIFRIDSIKPNDSVSFDDFTQLVRSSFIGNPEIELFLQGR